MNILDAGSGHNPHPKSTHLTDLFVKGTRHRGSLAHLEAVRDGRPFVCCDVQHLPFKKGVFDYVLCSHVVEHVPDPEAVFEEMHRVAPHGLISYPTNLWQTFTTNPGHLWQIDNQRKNHKSLFSGFRGATIAVIAPIMRRNFRIRIRSKLIELGKMLLKRDVHEGVYRW